MTLPHAVIWTDHHNAQVLHFDADTAEPHKLRAHQHPTGQHGSSVRAEHEFFGQLCDALDSTPEALVTGSHTALADFRHYADKHRPQSAARVAGYEVVDHLTEKQLLALGRRFFTLRDGPGNATL
jgi:hypothetical protein